MRSVSFKEGNFGESYMRFFDMEISMTFGSGGDVDL